MIRKQVYIEPWQEELLKRRSRELGVAEAELIRLSISEALTRRPGWRKPNPEAWHRIHAFIQKLMEMDVPQTGRDWTREDLYEERLSKLARGH